MEVEQYTEGVTGSQHVFSSHGFVFDMDIDTNGEYEELLLLGVGILSDGEARWYVEATAQVGDEGLAVPTITCIQGKHVWEDHYHDGAGCLGDGGQFVAEDAVRQFAVIQDVDAQGGWVWAVLVRDSDGEWRYLAEIRHPAATDKVRFEISQKNYNIYACAGLDHPPGYRVCEDQPSAEEG